MPKKNDLLFNLEVSKDRLSDDICALGYIQQEFIPSVDGIIDIPFIKNSLEILLKSMLYSQSEMEKVIEEAYKKD